MKVKTSIALSSETIREIDHFGNAYKNRSDFIEAAIKAFVKQVKRVQINNRDRKIIDKNASRLNSEAEDVLSFQIPL